MQVQLYQAASGQSNHFKLTFDALDFAFTQLEGARKASPRVPRPVVATSLLQTIALPRISLQASFKALQIGSGANKVRTWELRAQAAELGPAAASLRLQLRFCHREVC